MNNVSNFYPIFDVNGKDVIKNISMYDSASKIDKDVYIKLDKILTSVAMLPKFIITKQVIPDNLIF